MQSDRYAELLNVLRRWRDTFAGNLRAQIEGDAELTEQAGAIHHNEGVGEAFVPWLERFTRQLATQVHLKHPIMRVPGGARQGSCQKQSGRSASR